MDNYEYNTLRNHAKIKRADIEQNPYIAFGDIGQGWGYKEYGSWAFLSNDTVVYVPEYGIAIDCNGKEYAKDYYTKGDIIDLCKWYSKEYHKIINPDFLLNALDWSYPETLCEELCSWV